MTETDRMARGIVWDGNTLFLDTWPLKPLAEKEARIRLNLAGICNTDMELVNGYYNFKGRLGHEFIGEVVETGEGSEKWLNKRVAGIINTACGECDMCQMGHPSHCRNRHTLGISGGDYPGAFSTFFTLPEQSLVEVPDSIPDEEAVFIEPLAANCRITELHPINSSHNVVVVGAGKLGLLAAQVIHLTGTTLSVIIRRQKQRDLLEKWGITACESQDLPAEQADYVVDCTGQASGFEESLRLVRPRGTVILKSTFNGLTPANLTDVSVREIRIEGSRCGPFDAAIKLLAQKKVDVKAMIEASYPLREARKAFEHAGQKGTLKILLSPE